MLISDWSSDVCSSDLSLTICTSNDSVRASSTPFTVYVTSHSVPGSMVPPQVPGPVGQAIVGVMNNPTLHPALPKHDSRVMSSCNTTDRKSVGEGKSVSVSVDLGGCRTIKKNKN